MRLWRVTVAPKISDFWAVERICAHGILLHWFISTYSCSRWISPSVKMLQVGYRATLRTEVTAFKAAHYLLLYFCCFMYIILSTRECCKVYFCSFFKINYLHIIPHRTHIYRAWSCITIKINIQITTCLATNSFTYLCQLEHCWREQTVIMNAVMLFMNGGCQQHVL